MSSTAEKEAKSPGSSQENKLFKLVLHEVLSPLMLISDDFYDRSTIHPSIHPIVQ